MLRRHRWKWLGLAALAGALLAGWLVFFQEDQTIQYIGPKTRGVRDMLDWLDTPIDMAKFQGTRSLRETLVALMEESVKGGRDAPILVDREAFVELGFEAEIYEIPITFPVEARELSARQFLHHLIAQLPRDGAVILRQMGFIEVTTAERARRERADYYSEVSAMDWMRQFWSEAFGGEGHLPWSGTGIIGGKVKRLEEAS